MCLYSVDTKILILANVIVVTSLEDDVLVRCCVDDWVEVGEGHEAQQLHRLRRAPLARRAVRQRHVQLEVRGMIEFK